MASKFIFKSVLFAGLLLGGCSTDMAPQGDDQQTTSGATAQTKDGGGAKADAGAKTDAGGKVADAGTKDAGSSAGDEGDEPTDEPSDEPSDESDEPTDEPADEGDEAPPVDAGTKVDAGGTKADAGGGGAGGDCATLTYEAFGKGFLDTYCISCHGAMKPTFKTLAEVTTNKAKMKAEVTAKVMPPKGSKAPTDEERTQFAKFIDCGPK